MRIWLSILLAFGLAPPAAAQAPIERLRAELGTVRLVTGTEYPPFVDSSLPGGGVLTALVREAFRAVGIPITLEVMSWGDGYRGVRDGAFDATFPYYATRARRAELQFSAPLFNVDQSLFQRSPPAITFHRLDDLIGAQLCNPGGYAPPLGVQRLVDAGQLVVSAAPTPLDCLQRVAAGGLSGVILPRLQVLSLLQNLPFDLAESDTPVERRWLHVAATNANPRGAQVLDAFAQGRAALERANGWNRIIVRHLGVAVLNWNRFHPADPEDD